MPQMNVENLRYVSHPDLEFTDIEIRLDDIEKRFVVTAGTAFSFQQLKEFAILINDVLEMEADRLEEITDKAIEELEAAETDH